MKNETTVGNSTTGESSAVLLDKSASFRSTCRYVAFSETPCLISIWEKKGVFKFVSKGPVYARKNAGRSFHSSQHVKCKTPFLPKIRKTEQES
jgi:hypothetical protein